MQPQEAKRTVAIAVGLVVLGAVIWVSAKSRSNPAPPDPTIASAIRGLNPDALAAPPNKVVTMLSVPEVIYSSLPETTEIAPEAKPSKAPGDTDAKVTQSNRKGASTPSSATTTSRKPAGSSGRRSEDTFLVKPQ